VSSQVGEQCATELQLLVFVDIADGDTPTQLLGAHHRMIYDTVDFGSVA